MNNLLKIKDMTLASRAAAEAEQLPLCIKFKPTRISPARTISVNDLLTNGASDACGLEALFAYKLMHSNEYFGRTTAKLNAISSGNLGSTLYTSANIHTITLLLPTEDSDAKRLFDWLTANRESEETTVPATIASDFTYFKPTIKLTPSTVITPGIKTLACIYHLLQDVNSISPSAKLKDKIDFALSKTNS